MPTQPTWFLRIPALLEQLRADGIPAEFTRRDLERWLGVRRRRAIRLLHELHAGRRQQELVATRESLVAYLELRWDAVVAERMEARQAAVSAALGEARRALRLPKIQIAEPVKFSQITFAGLPEGIRLRRDELSISFLSAQDLLEKLFSLAQALANDFEGLEQALNPN